MVDENATVTWASEAVHRQFEKVVGKKVSQLIAFAEPRQDCSVASLSARLGRWCKLALLGADAEIPLAGRWFTNGREFILLATPNPSTSKDLGRLTFDDFPENDHLVDLLVARDENARSLAEASSVAEALKQKSRDAEQAEKMIRESEMRLKAILDTVHAGILLIDAETHQIIDANTFAVRMIGVPKEEIIGKICHQFICSAERGKCPITDLGQQIDYSEQMLLTADGNQIPVLKTVSRIILDGKDCLLDSFVDLSKQKQAEEQLRQKSEFLHNVLESLTHPFYVIDANSYVIKMANRAACEENLIGKAMCYSITHRRDEPCDGMNDLCPLIEVKKTRKPVVVEHVHYNEQHEPRHMELHAYPIFDGQGEVSEIIEYAFDITDREKAKEELKTHRRLVEAAHKAGMGEVATDILHNVGNVLNSINVSACSIRDIVLNSRTGNLKKVVDMISEHAHELGRFLTEDERGRHIPTYLKEVAALMVGEQADIIDKTCSLTKHIEHVKQIVQSQQKYARVGGVEVLTSIREIIDDAIQINQEGLKRHGVTLRFELAELPEMHIDKQRVLQILVNLISNGKYAVSQSDKQEKVLIIRSFIHGENRMRIEVVDNGIGIAKENLSKVFQHGFTTKKEGHGFGLHSSFLAAREMGGSLTAQSDGPGCGATFTLELPLIKSEAKIDG